MQTKPLLYGLIGFLLGGLLVSIAATTFDKPKEVDTNNTQSTVMTMDDMTQSLRTKTGDDFDVAFLNYMMEHHQAAVDMARLSAQNAKHDEIKQLSNDIITAQEKEINQMMQWQMMWEYSSSENMNHMMP